MKILHNSTDKKVNIVYKGAEYSIEPNSDSKNLHDDIIDFWKEVHQFLIVKELPKAGEKKEEVKEEVKEEEKEEEKEDSSEKSKSSKKSKKTKKTNK